MATQSLPPIPFILAPEPPTEVYTNFSPAVDFCIWVLQQDGLQVPPFDIHSEGDRQLSQAGMTSESWQQWTKRVVLLNHTHLSWNSRQLDRDTWVEEHLRRAQGLIKALLQTPDWQMFGLMDSDFLHHRLGLHYDHFVEHQKAILKHLSDVPASYLECCDNPALVWSDAPSIGQKLEQLWRQYHWDCRVSQAKSLIDPHNKGQLKRGSSTYLPSDLNFLPCLNIHWVGYPKPIEWLVQPESIVVAQQAWGVRFSEAQRSLHQASQQDFQAFLDRTSQILANRRRKK